MCKGVTVAKKFRYKTWSGFPISNGDGLYTYIDIAEDKSFLVIAGFEVIGSGTAQALDLARICKVSGDPDSGNGLIMGWAELEGINLEFQGTTPVIEDIDSTQLVDPSLNPGLLPATVVTGNFRRLKFSGVSVTSKVYVSYIVLN